MTEQDPDAGFEVRDRRRRQDDEPSSPVQDRPGPSAPPPPSAEPSLVGLFMMLASVALAALEGDPAGGERHKDPRQAAELIDTLILLRERTEGRRTPEESQVLDELLYDLQIRYVRATNRS